MATLTSTSALSTSVRVRYPANRPEGPVTLHSAAAQLSEFGEIARLDVSLSGVNSCVLVTYFDVRSAQRCMICLAAPQPGLLQTIMCAESFPNAAHDFRCVRVEMQDLPEISFQTFGEIVGVTRSEGAIVVEFYDLRAAQKVICTVDGSMPATPPPSPTMSPTMSATMSHTLQQQQQQLQPLQQNNGLLPPAMTQSQPLGSPMRPPGQFPSGALQEDLSHSVPLMSLPQQLQPQQLQSAAAGQLHVPPPGLSNSLAAWEQRALSHLVQPQGLAGAGGGPQSFDPDHALASAILVTVARSLPHVGMANAFPEQNNLHSNPDAAFEDNKTEQTSVGGGRQPAQTKVTSQDLVAFDVKAKKIRSGEDTRTTVMLRNISRTVCAEVFVKLLAACDLQDRYTFLYLPFDKRRNVRTGFAFVNFMLPEDVLRLYLSMQGGAWHKLFGDSSGPMPALSYARLQGHEAIAKHFSSSAVMYDHDVQKRPLFLGGVKAAAAFKEDDPSAENTVKAAAM